MIMITETLDMERQTFTTKLTSYMHTFIPYTNVYTAKVEAIHDSVMNMSQSYYIAA